MDGGLAAGIMAGALFAFYAHAMTRFTHVQALHNEFLPLALLALDEVPVLQRLDTGGEFQRVTGDEQVRLDRLLPRP